MSVDTSQLMRQALHELERAQLRIAELERARQEPVAVVGLGCRIPGGARGPDALWSLLARGADLVGEVPADRWNAQALMDPDPDAPGRIYTRAGSFLSDVDCFDADFFGISPREAENMDPQQRILLETAWEALEHAGIPADCLAGTAAGVFIGMMNQDYSRLLTDLRDIGVYSGTGNSASVASGRLAYVLGLQGPALTLDTACSSSLVAVHLACQSLRAGDCRLALAGGVNLMLSPAALVAECRARMLSPTGMCRTFDAAADGFVRGEGCGVAVLKRLSDARLDKDRILAVIRGSAVNHDGRSSGLTVPSGPAQQEVIRRALESAGLDPSEIGFLEAHGTGTALGDPVELRALAAVFGQRPLSEPLLIGSLKTNAGHLEGAAGIAGFIKAVLCVQKGLIPPHLHLANPTPHVDWQALPLKVPTTLTPWPAGRTPRLAGVSSFGFSGTNAHVIVEQPPAPAPAQARPIAGKHLLVLSAKSADALRELAGRYAGLVRDLPANLLPDLCASALAGRAHLKHRLAIAAAEPAEFSACLAAYADGSAAGFEQAGPAGAFHAASPGPLQEAARGYASGTAVPPVPDAQGQRLDLPTYPFRRKRFWLPASAGTPPEPAPLPAPAGQGLPLYELAWQEVEPQAGPAPDWLPKAPELAAALAASVREILASPEIEQYGAALDRLEDISVDGAVSALTALGMSWEPGARVTAAGLAARLGIAQRHRRLLERVLQILGEAGVLRQADNDWKVRQPRTPADPVARLDACAQEAPEVRAEITLLRRAVPRLADAWRGVVEPLELLFPNGDESVAADLYFRSPGARAMNTIVADALAAALARAPAGTRPRILEIGGGTGGTTAHLLARPELARADYCFTDLSPAFLARAQTRFAAHPNVSYRLLDIAKPPAGQGLSGHAFEVIIAANVLHATPSLPDTLRHVRDLLTPGGLLILLEGTVPFRPVDLVFGLTEGWWVVRDSERPSGYPLMPSANWVRLLAETGFPQARALPESAGLQARLTRQAVILATAGPAAPAGEPGAWLLLHDQQPLGEALGRALRDQGHDVVELRPGPELARLPAGGYQVPHDQPDTIRGLLRALEADGVPRPAGLISLLALKAPDAAGLDAAAAGEAARKLCSSARALACALAPGGERGPAALWFVTRDAQPVDGSEALGGLAQSPLWGLAKGIAAEFPGLGGGIADLEAAGPDRLSGEARGLAALITRNPGERLLAFRGSRLLAPRLRPSEPGRPEPVRVSGNAQYLITGGLGGLGLEAAQWLADRGAKHLALVGRRAPGPDTEPVLAKLRGQGVNVRVFQADVADEPQMRAVFDALAREGVPLRGVLHAAGVPGYALLADLTPQALAEVLRPKVQGAWVLHTLTRDLALDFFVCYSSMTSIWGVDRQAHYMAANQFLDSLAPFRNARGLPGVTINWGPVEGRGMLLDGAAGRLRDLGVHTLPLSVVRRALDSLGAGPRANVTVADMDWRRFRELYETRGGRRILQQVAPEPAAPGPDRRPPPPGPILPRLDTAPDDQRAGLLRTYLAGIIAAAMKLEPDAVAQDRPLPELGLDSLVAVELRNTLRRDLETDLPAAALLDGSSVADLAAALMAQLAGKRPATAAPAPVGPAPAADQPMSYGQRALWFVHTLSPASPAYNIQCAFTLLAPVNLDALRSAARALALRHEPLRSLFAQGPAGPVQRVLPARDLPVEVADASGWSCADLAARLAAEADRPFALDRAPPLRLHVWLDAPVGDARREPVLVAVAHHIAMDFASIEILARELDQLYGQACGRTAEPLPALPRRFSDYVAWESGLASGDYGEQALAYARQELAGVPQILDLPTDRPRPAVQTYAGAALASGLSAADTAAVKSAAAAAGATPFMLALAAYNVLLHRLSGQAQFLVGTHVDNRGQPGFEGLMGYFVNQVVLRADLSQDPTLAELLGRVRRQALRAFAFRHYPFAKLVEQLRPARDPARSPLFQADIVWDQARRPEPGEGPAAHLIGRLFASDQRGADFDLMLTVVDLGGPYRIVWRYNTDLFTVESVRQIHGQYEALLRLFAAKPAVRLSEVELWTESETERIQRAAALFPDTKL